MVKILKCYKILLTDDDRKCDQLSNQDDNQDEEYDS
jgi:hypothetical protein